MYINETRMYKGGDSPPLTLFGCKKGYFLNKYITGNSG